MKPAIIDALVLVLFRSLHGTTHAERRIRQTEWAVNDAELADIVRRLEAQHAGKVGSGGDP